MNLNLEKYIPKREKFLINNKYEIIKNKKDDFHCVIYYLSKNKIEIIVRKLNNNLGWDYDLKIKFLEDNYLISIGSCPDNYKIIELYCKFEIKYDHPKDLFYIPKMIIQTNNLMCKNFDHYNTVMTLLEKNPSYDYIFFNDLDARIFIKENFLVNILNTEKKENDVSDVLKAYDMIKPGAIKADLFRYCYLYINGGIYIDSKISNFIELDKILKVDDKLLLCSDDAKNSFYNGIIMIEKNNFNLLQLIKEVLNNVFNHNYLTDIHEPTGNKLFYKFLKDNNTKLNKRKNIVYLNNQPAFNCEYKNYYKLDYKNFRVNYMNKDYYYYYNFYLGHYIFKFPNTIKSYIFSIFHLKENIFVLKNSSNHGWNIDFTIEIFDTKTGKSHNMNIEKNNESEYVFSV